MYFYDRCVNEKHLVLGQYFFYGRRLGLLSKLSSGIHKTIGHFFHKTNNISARELIYNMQKRLLSTYYVYKKYVNIN